MEMNNRCPWLNNPVTYFRLPNDSLFKDGDMVCQTPFKQLHVDIDNEEFLHKCYSKFVCKESGCKQEFEDIMSYEIHYNSIHRSKCDICHKFLPSTYLLGIHIAEMHDSYFSTQVEKSYPNLYVCFVESCDVKFQSPEERKVHLSDVHQFPANYKFEKYFRSSERKQNPMETENSHASKQRRFPKTICFGQGSVRGFNLKKTKYWHQQKAAPNTPSNIENVNVDDLKDALIDV